MKTSIKELDKFQRRARFKNRWITPWHLYKEDGDKDFRGMWLFLLCMLNVLVIPAAYFIPTTTLGWCFSSILALGINILAVYLILWSETKEEKIGRGTVRELQQYLPKAQCLSQQSFKEYVSNPTYLAELYVDEKFSTARLQLTTQLIKTKETIATLNSMPDKFRETVYTQKLIDNLQTQKQALQQKLDEVNTAQSSFGSQISSQLEQMVAGEQLRQIIRGSELFIKNRTVLQEVEDSLCQLRQTCSELCARQQDLEVESSALTRTVHELGTVYTQVAQK